MNSRDNPKRLIRKLLDADYNSKDKVSNNEQAQPSLTIEQTQGGSISIKKEIQDDIAAGEDKILQTI